MQDFSLEFRPCLRKSSVKVSVAFFFYPLLLSREVHAIPVFSHTFIYSICGCSYLIDNATILLFLKGFCNIIAC